MLRDCRASEASSSTRTHHHHHHHHQRCISEPSTLTPAAVLNIQTNNSQQHQTKVASLAARRQSTTIATNTTRLSGRYQKKRSSTLERTTTVTTTTKPSATSKSSSLSSTLQQIGDWARRSFRGQAGVARRADGRRPKSLHNDYVVREASSGIVVERKSTDRVPVGASRDQSPVTTSSGYASGGDVGVYSRLHDLVALDEAAKRQRQAREQADWAALCRDGRSRGSRRYRRRTSPRQPTYVDDVKPEVIPPTASSDEKCEELPVYENLLKNSHRLQADRWADSHLRQHKNERLENSRHRPEVLSAHRMSQMTEEAADTGNGSIDDYLVAVEHLCHSSFVKQTDAETGSGCRRDPSPVYVNANLLMTSLNQSGRCPDTVRRCRSRSLSSSRDRTLTEQSTTFNFADVPQRLTFTPSFVDRSASSPDHVGPEADWDDRLSTLSIGCRRAPRPETRAAESRSAAGSPRRSKSARRRLPFDGDWAMTSFDQRPEAVDESVRPLFAPCMPTPIISNVVERIQATLRQQPRRRSGRLFPGVHDEEESIYETINDVVATSDHPTTNVTGKCRNPDYDVIGRFGYPTSDVRGKSEHDVIGHPTIDAAGRRRAIRVPPEVEFDATEHVYDNIDDVLLSSCRLPPSADIHSLPPPLPPPPVPARRSAAAMTGRELPLCRTDVVDLDSHHVYTIGDVLDSFEALAEHLPRAQRFIHDLQAAAYVQRSRQEHRQGGGVDATEDEQRWIAAAKNRGTRRRDPDGRAAAGDAKSSTWYGGAAQRRLRRHTAMTSSDEYQPIVVENYVCSPGNRHSSERPRRSDVGPRTGSATSAHHELYVPMKPAGKAGTTVFCFGRQGASLLDGVGPRQTPYFASDAVRRSKLPTRKIGQGALSRLSSGALSRSVTHLDQSANLDGLLQSLNTAQATAAGNSAADRRRGEFSQQTRALSRSLMDDFACQLSRRSGPEVLADRKQNVTSPTVGVDLVSARSYTTLDRSSGDLAAQPARGTTLRSASEDRLTGSSKSMSKSPMDAPVRGKKHRQAGKSSHRGRPTDRTTSGLSRSLVGPALPPMTSQQPASDSVSASFHECPTHSDSRRSSILQWNEPSCGRREIFC